MKMTGFQFKIYLSTYKNTVELKTSTFFILLKKSLNLLLRYLKVINDTE